MGVEVVGWPPGGHRQPQGAGVSGVLALSRPQVPRSLRGQVPFDPTLGDVHVGRPHVGPSEKPIKEEKTYVDFNYEIEAPIELF